MEIVIHNGTSQAIYQQIYNQIKEQVLSNKLTEGELLPSIRVLAKELRVSVITTKRAYEELERDGFILTTAGKGSFVARRNPELVREERLKEIEGHIGEILRLAKSGGISVEEVFEIFRVMEEEL